MLRRVSAAILAGAVAVIAGTSCPEVSAEPVEEGSLIRVRHNESQPLTAFLLEIVDYPGNHFAHMEDDLMRPHTAAGNERRVVVQSLMPGTVPDYLKVTAAIYVDGRACGSADKVKLIVDARRRRLKLTREIVSRIEQAASARRSTDDLRAELTEWIRSASPASSAVVTHVAEQLKLRSPDEVLAALRIVERTLAASKPTP